MTLVCGALPPSAATVTITLDTTPPVLHLTGDGRLEPPDTGEYLLRSSEPVGRYRVIFYDSADRPLMLGAALVDDYTLRFTLPASGLPQGYGRLLMVVTDRACNEAVTEARVYISRPRTMDLDLYCGPAERLVMTTGVAVDLTTESSATSDLDLRQNRLYEMTSTNADPFEMEMRTDGDQ